MATALHDLSLTAAARGVGLVVVVGVLVVVGLLISTGAAAV